MTLIDDLEATNDVALAVTSALEQVLGDDVILAVGVAQRQAPDADLLPDGASRAVSLPFTEGVDGEIALIVSEQLAITPRGACLRRAAHVEHCRRARSRRDRDERASSTTSCTSGGRSKFPPTSVTADDGEFIVYPLLQNDERVACLVIKLTAIDEAPTSVALHEFAADHRRWARLRRQPSARDPQGRRDGRHRRARAPAHDGARSARAHAGIGDRARPRRRLASRRVSSTAR